MADRSVFNRVGRRSGGRGGRPSGPYDWRDRPRQWKDRKPGIGESPPQPLRGEDGELNRSRGAEGGEAGSSHGAPGRDGDHRQGGDHGDHEPRRVIKKFSNKARLFVGNLPRDFSEEELRKLFEPHGEVQEVYVHKEKSFGFVRMVSSVPGRLHVQPVLVFNPLLPQTSLTPCVLRLWE